MHLGPANVAAAAAAAGVGNRWAGLSGSGLVAAALVSAPVCLHCTNAKLARVSPDILYNFAVAYKCVRACVGVVGVLWRVVGGIWSVFSSEVWSRDSIHLCPINTHTPAKPVQPPSPTQPNSPTLPTHPPTPTPQGCASTSGSTFPHSPPTG